MLKQFAYGTPAFVAATDLATRMTHSGRFRGAAGSLLRHPGLPSALLALRHLPTVEVLATAESVATWRSPRFGPATRPLFDGHRAQAVLDLQLDDVDYLVGRRKQALRTNLRHARAHQVQVSALETYDEWFSAATEVLLARDGGQEVIDQMEPPHRQQSMGYFVARDAADRPVAFVGVAIFNDCGVLFSLLSIPSHPASSSARYLLHTLMRSELRSRGMRHLIVGSAIRETAGNQYFQYLLGYEVRNLEITIDLRDERPAKGSGLNGDTPRGAVCAPVPEGHLADEGQR